MKEFCFVLFFSGQNPNCAQIQDTYPVPSQEAFMNFSFLIGKTGKIIHS